MSQKRAIVLDFDGTIADTVPIIQAMYREMAHKKNWTPLTKEAYIELRKGTLSEARQWSGVRFWQLPFVVRSAKTLLKLESEKVQLFSGMNELIQEYSDDKDIDLYVLSRNTHDTIAAVLQREGLLSDIKILTIQRFFGGKTRTLKQLIKKHGYKPQNVWMVGDEVRDIQAAKQSGVRSIAVTWGIQDESILRCYKPDIVVNTVDELRTNLQS